MSTLVQFQHLTSIKFETAVTEFAEALAREVPQCSIAEVVEHGDDDIEIFLNYKPGSESSLQTSELAVEIGDKYGIIITTNLYGMNE
jgi:hypothetical protein